MGTITKLEFQKRRKNRVNVYVDGSYLLALPSIVVGERRMKVGDAIDERELSSIAATADAEEAWACALDYATRKMRTRREVREHLAKKEYMPESVRIACDKLVDYGYLDEDAYLSAYIADHSERDGKIKMTYELKCKGFSSERIEAALSALDQRDACRRLAQKYLANKTADFALKVKLSRYLYSRGFDSETIRTATEEIDCVGIDE